MIAVRGRQRLELHRPVDVVVGVVGGVASAPLWLAALAASAISTRSTGIFRQARVGQNGRTFTILKLRTMRTDSSGSTVTTADDDRITGVGAWIRRLKLDEFPQLINVIQGEMALLGPRPDVPGFADRLRGHGATVLDVRPGISGPATIFLRNEEVLLSAAPDADGFNRDVLFPLKTRLNLRWIEHGTLADDIRIALWTVIPPSPDSLYRLFEKWDASIRDWPEVGLIHQIQDVNSR